jgi:hypothetical protein
MNIADLKKLIQDLPDDAVVGVTDHFGALEEIDASDCTYYAPNEHWRVKQAFFCLPNVDIGPEPD